jgi:hypothetical protein
MCTIHQELALAHSDHWEVESIMSESNDKPADAGDYDPCEELKRGLPTPRVPADVKAQILAELPPLEEIERQIREMQEKGGLTSEEFFKALGLEREQQHLGVISHL